MGKDQTTRKEKDNMEDPDLKLCIDCSHSVSIEKKGRDPEHYCSFLGAVGLIDGSKPLCAAQRAESGICGKKAVNFLGKTV